MSAEGVVVRPAAGPDLPAIQEIYAHHVLGGLGTFEEIAPDVVEIGRRRTDLVAAGLPYLVAERAGVVAGFAYAAPYRMRAAYRLTVEDSVYVGPNMLRCGIGRVLLAEVIAACTVVGYRQMVAVIGGSDNLGSIGLHASLGFEKVGVLRGVGHKFGGFVDTVLMQLTLDG